MSKIQITGKIELTNGEKWITFYPNFSASSLFRPRRFAPANGGVFSPNLMAGKKQRRNSTSSRRGKAFQGHLG